MEFSDIKVGGVHLGELKVFGAGIGKGKSTYKEEDRIGSRAAEAMNFAMNVHSKQMRKYTGAPYATHLAEVAGIVAAAGIYSGDIDTVEGRDIVIATAWLHDCIEDQDVTITQLIHKFGLCVAAGVNMLSDTESGNRALRKSLARDRLKSAPPWIQSIKYADIISNSSSIKQHDPQFAVVYLREVKELLEVMDKGHAGLYTMARRSICQHDAN